jgi:hypothetical protein
VLTASILIALMMEAVSTTSETSVNFYQTTRRNIREDSDLHPLIQSFLPSFVSHLKSCSPGPSTDSFLLCFQGIYEKN